MELKHSEVRRIVLDEHNALRRQLRDIGETLEDVANDRPGSGDQLVTQWLGFAFSFLEHVQHEETLLRPVLEDIDAWAQVRVDRMDEDHLQQRSRVRDLMQTLTANPLEATEDLREFLDELAVDMDEEERLNLGEELMRDEVLPYPGGFSG
jgi:hemerythrin-like domain-containing protein